jgi:SAM-dependent methyltransferase
MSLADEYRRQLRWRPWPRILDALPAVQGQRILDLGCGLGDLTAALVARGAIVTGIDVDEELLRGARSKGLRNAEFRQANLKALPDFGGSVDGIWSSFTAAYFTDLPAALSSWAKPLRRGGWIALTEIDDLFGHEPLGSRAKAMLRAYAEAALGAKRYDFHMGRKLRPHLEGSGFEVVKAFDLEDPELCFSGPARPEVVDAWRDRFNRMKLLRESCGSEFDAIREEFLACLARPDHCSQAKVQCCIGIKSG